MSKHKRAVVSFFFQRRVIFALVGVTLGLSLLAGSYQVYQHWFGSRRQYTPNGWYGQGVAESSPGHSPTAGGTGPAGQPQQAGEAPEAQMELPPLPAEKPSNRFTVLLVGLDRRPGEKSIGNTDTLILAQFNPDTGQIALLSVPRDTQVAIPAHGQDKINAAARLGGGLAATRRVLEQLLGQRIDGYVLANFYGFKQIVDDLGGITVDVEKDMHYNTGDREDGVINLHQGVQRLNGTQTLEYVRFRNDALADISRTQRQQKVLKAMGQEFMQLKTLPKLPWLIPEMYKTIETDLPLSKLLVLANFGVRADPGKIVSQTLPGNFSIEKGISYWKVRPGECRQVATKLFRDGKTSAVFSGQVPGNNDPGTGSQVAASQPQPLATPAIPRSNVSFARATSNIKPPATVKDGEILAPESGDGNRNPKPDTEEHLSSRPRDLGQIEEDITVEVQNLP